MVKASRIAVLVSGSGSNLQAMLDAHDSERLATRPVLVVSNRPGVRALDRARAAGVEALVVDHKNYADRSAFDAALSNALEERNIDLVVLAGFMRLLGSAFVGRWRGRLVNIHPSLLPAFPGAYAIRDALAAQATTTGVSVHFVDEGTDTGPLIAQESVKVFAEDTEETLATRIHTVEHRLYPKVVDALARGAVRLDGRRVVNLEAEKD